jgi:carbon monoxide dehydrogenase subunit G
VIDAERPARIVERNIGAGGTRVATGTYTLTDRPEGGTPVEFEYAWQQVPLSERVMAPVVRGMLRRANERAMERLAQQIGTAVGV